MRNHINKSDLIFAIKPQETAIKYSQKIEIPAKSITDFLRSGIHRVCFIRLNSPIDSLRLSPSNFIKNISSIKTWSVHVERWEKSNQT